MSGICNLLKASILSSSVMALGNATAILEAFMTEEIPLTDNILAALVDENAMIGDVWTAIL